MIDLPKNSNLILVFTCSYLFHVAVLFIFIYDLLHVNFRAVLHGMLFKHKSDSMFTTHFVVYLYIFNVFYFHSLFIHGLITDIPLQVSSHFIIYIVQLRKLLCVILLDDREINFYSH